ncbi:septal ring lytic transglycosylase RlpA family protein [Marinimicrobium locisalis]|uniref:septal ring lytic transglycosylase RlpA family protein n=1 Tax=Marinimicrobium locisalis TaxID=546022 RepID=UPI003D3014BC
MKFCASLAVVALSVLVVACAPLLEEQDRGPDRPVDLSHVPDAEPREEPRTIAGNKNPYTVLGKTYHLMDDETGYKERGIASWYGQKFHGRNTSNGEVYDMYAMTAAHKTLPIPSYVRVTNLDNGRQVVVRVNDRGPFHAGRIIDLSYAAAQKLGFAARGTAQVEVEIIVPGDRPPAPLKAKQVNAKQEGPTVGTPSAATFTPVKSTQEAPKDRPMTFVQVGAFSSLAAAEKQRTQLERFVEQPVLIYSPDEEPVLHRVRIGPLHTTKEVTALREQLRKNAIDQTHIIRE